MKTEFKGSEIETIITYLTQPVRQRMKVMNMRRPSIRDSEKQGAYNIYSIEDALWFEIYSNIRSKIHSQIESVIIANNINMKNVIAGGRHDNQGTWKEFNFYVQYSVTHGNITSDSNDYLASLSEIQNKPGLKTVLVINVQGIKEELFNRINLLFP